MNVETMGAALAPASLLIQLCLWTVGAILCLALIGYLKGKFERPVDNAAKQQAIRAEAERQKLLRYCINRDYLAVHILAVLKSISTIIGVHSTQRVEDIILTNKSENINEYKFRLLRIHSNSEIDNTADIGTVEMILKTELARFGVADLKVFYTNERLYFLVIVTAYDVKSPPQ